MNWPPAPITRVLAIEFATVVVIAASATVFGSTASYSALLGGMLFFLPNAYFTLYTFRYRGVDWTPWIAFSVYRGQAAKLMLSAVGFALVFRFFETLQAGTMFVVFGVMMFLHIVLTSYATKQLETTPLKVGAPNSTGIDT